MLNFWLLLPLLLTIPSSSTCASNGAGMGTMTLLIFISEVEREAAVPAAELVPLVRGKEALGGLELAM